MAVGPASTHYQQERKEYKEYGLFNHNITSLNAKDLSMTNRYNSQIKAIPIFLQIYVRG
ncbi:hypothetical protein LAWASA_1280 [Lawsonibacter asaccharolyticus]|nr:hypothetical protein LAWASA_1280 [Lawsonibacter asaccharolyticus]